MNEIINIVIGLLGATIILRGCGVFIVNRNNIKNIVGLNISRDVFKISSKLFIILLLLFSFIFYLNLQYNLVTYEININFYAILRDAYSLFLSSIFEEFIFRVLIFLSLVKLLKNEYLIILISALIFSAIHFPANIVSSVSYLLGGVMYGYSYFKFKNIIIPIILHFSWNFIQGVVFGFPVSGITLNRLLYLNITPSIFFNGGGQGIEGSIMGIVIRLVIIVAIYLFPYKGMDVKFMNLYKTI